MERKHESKFYYFLLFEFYYYTQHKILRKYLGFKIAVETIKMTNANER